MDARALLEMEIQAPDGSVEGPLDLHLIRERIYAGRYRGQEQVRVRGGSWRGMVSFSELAEVLELVGVDVQAMQIRERQAMTGWKASQEEPAPAPARVEERVEGPKEVAPTSEERKKKLPLPAIIAVVAGLAAVALAILFLS